MMSSREHEHDGDAAVRQMADALRADVPVRPEWRDAVLAGLDALPPPRRRGTPARLAAWIRGPWALTPLTGVAAAIGFIALGIAGTLTFLRPPAPMGTMGSDNAAAAQTVADVQPSAGTGQSSGGTSVRFVIVSANASRVSLVGDFNSWNPSAMPMHRLGDGGAWVREVVLEPGRHVYAFYVDGALQVDPSAPRAAEDDFGIPSSALVVRTVNQ